MRRGKRRCRNYSEKKFREALQVLKEEGCIEDYYVAHDNQELDASGVDYLIFLKGGLVFAVQLKSRSSEKQFAKKLESHYEKHPLIKEVIGISPNDSCYHICTEIIRRINAAIRMTKEITQYKLSRCQNE